MIWAVAFITIVLVLAIGLLGGAGFIGSYHDSQHKPSVVQKIMDWMF